jgi:hypothetical protein
MIQSRLPRWPDRDQVAVLSPMRLGIYMSLTRFPFRPDLMATLVDGQEVSWEEWLERAPMAESVWLMGRRGVTSLPLLENAKEVVLCELPDVTSLEPMPKATGIVLNGFEQITSLPSMDSATSIAILGFPRLTSLPSMKNVVETLFEGLPLILPEVRVAAQRGRA